MAFHSNLGWLFAINGLLYVGHLAFSEQWRHLVPERRAGLVEAPQVVAHDLHLRGETPPQGRYNAAQQVTYTLVIVMGALVVASGVAILKPSQANPLTTILGGYESARFLYFSSFIGFALPTDQTTDQAASSPATDDDRALAERAERLDAQGRQGRTITVDEYRSTSRRAFLGGAVGVAAGVAGFRWVQAQEHVDGIPAVLRRGHEFNDDLWRTIGTTGRRPTRATTWASSEPTASTPQTLLAWGLGGEPLAQDHGAPLRLYSPNHYGVKSPRRIGVVRFVRDRPPDYWGERSYDWNSRLWPRVTSCARALVPHTRCRSSLRSFCPTTPRVGSSLPRAPHQAENERTSAQTC